MLTRRLIGAALVAALQFAATAAFSSEVSLKGDLVADLAQIEQKIVGLAEAIPAEKYGWRPAEGVRSVSEAMMHLAGANYFFPTVMGQSVPDGVNPRGLEQITDKAKVIETVKASFAHLKKMIENTDDGKMGDEMEYFGQTGTVAGFLHAAVSHGHEHLGQLIAYARTNEIAPPWSQG